MHAHTHIPLSRGQSLRKVSMCVLTFIFLIDFPPSHIESSSHEAFVPAGVTAVCASQSALITRGLGAGNAGRPREADAVPALTGHLWIRRPTGQGLGAPHRGPEGQPDTTGCTLLCRMLPAPNSRSKSKTQWGGGQRATEL